MDRIFIEGLRIDTVIGIYGWERKIKQTVVIDLEIGVDIRNSAYSDCIDDTLSYKSVVKRLIEVVDQAQFYLVEALAERIATIVREEFAAPWVRVRVNKIGALRQAQGAGVIIERGSRA